MQKQRPRHFVFCLGNCLVKYVRVIYSRRWFVFGEIINSYLTNGLGWNWVVYGLGWNHHLAISHFHGQHANFTASICAGHQCHQKKRARLPCCSFSLPEAQSRAHKISHDMDKHYQTLNFRASTSPWPHCKSYHWMFQIKLGCASTPTSPWCAQKQFSWDLSSAETQPHRGCWAGLRFPTLARNRSRPSSKLNKFRTGFSKSHVNPISVKSLIAWWVKSRQCSLPCSE